MLYECYFVWYYAILELALSSKRIRISLDRGLRKTVVVLE